MEGPPTRIFSEAAINANPEGPETDDDDDGRDVMLSSGDSFPEEECLIISEDPQPEVGEINEPEGELPTPVEPEKAAPADLTETLVFPPELSGEVLRFNSQLDRTPELLAALGSLETTLGKRIDGLQQAFDRELRAESTREKVVDRLHAELQEYKNDFLLNVLRPVFIDLIQLHDDIGKIIQLQQPTEGEAVRLLGLMGGFQQGIEDILYRQGVEPFSLEDDAFDPRKQRAFSTVPTEDPELNKKVAARLRKGFRSGDKVIRPEVVSVYSMKR